MGKRFTFEDVKQYFEDQGCELLEKEYINCKTKMEYRCSCKNISKITFDDFKSGTRCKTCGIEKRAAKKRYSFDYVYNYFKEQECELLEKKYIDNRTKMKYKCSCGNISTITFSHFLQGYKCNQCSQRKRSTFLQVKQYFEDQGCELLAKEYKNMITKMKYRCSCGNISKINFHNFQNKRRCKKCGLKRTIQKQKLNFEDVKQYFEDQGCELLEKKYINNRTKMKYKCSCENISTITFSSFKKGVRCKKCCRKRAKQTMIAKYGVPFFVSGTGYSKESQKLFDCIYENLTSHYQNKTYYATLNQEFGINYKNKWFSYDFVNSEFKKVIEYNGKCWHPQPHLKDNDIGWHAMNKNQTAKEAREYEKIKYDGAKTRGYKILTIWDNELHQDFNNLVQKCLDFLYS